MLDRRRASLAKFLCLLPFMVSVLVPAGLMPAVSNSGTFTLIICDGHGSESHSTDGESEEGASSWCPFSLLSASVLLPAQFSQGRTIHDAVAQVSFVDRDVPATTDIAASRPRGPPLIL